MAILDSLASALDLLDGDKDNFGTLEEELKEMAAVAVLTPR